jgi:serine/threonine-protein kinase
VKQRGKAVRGDERVGRFIDGRYRIVELLAIGAMARVYRAEQKDPPCELAVKVLGREIAVHKTAAARFHREAKAASRLDHPGIVRIYGWGVSGDVPFIAMELLQGRDLFAVLEREERLTQERAVRLAMLICDALQAAHDSGVVHRDLKPENVMVLERDAHGEERIKLLDFGIAKMAPRAENSAYNDETFPQVLTKVGSAVGTPSHMAPEQARGVGVDGRADIYALGVLLYEMVTGHLPFEGSNPIDVAVRQVREAPPPPSRYLREIHRGLESIILRCLEKDPVARWQNARDVNGELLRVLNDLTGEEPVTQQTAAADEDELPTRERDVRDVRALLNKLLPVRRTTLLEQHNEPSTDSLDTQPAISAYDPETFDSLTDVTSPGPSTLSDITKPEVSARPNSTMRAREPHPRSTLRAGQMPDTVKDPRPPERTDEDDLTTLNMEAPARVTKGGALRPRLVTEEDDTTTMPQEERKKEIIRAIAEARRQAERLATQELHVPQPVPRTPVLDDYEPPRSARARFDASLSLPAPQPQLPPQPPPQPQSVQPPARDPQEELESLLKRVPPKRSVFPAIALVLAIVIAGALLYVAFYGVPNVRYARDVLRFLKGLI